MGRPGRPPTSGSWTPGTCGNPDGRPRTHGVRSLQVQRQVGQFDADTEAAVTAIVLEYAQDSGGLERLSNRELALLRDAAICELIVSEAFGYARRCGSIFQKNGQLLPVLDRNLLAYANTKRLNLVAVGLRGDRAEFPTCAHCGEYLAHRYVQHTCPKGPQAAEAAAAATEPAVVGEGEG